MSSQTPAEQANLPDSHLQLARTLKQTDQPTQAITAYLKAIELKPDWHPDIYREAAEFLAQQPSHLQQAATLYRKAAALKPDWNSHFYSQFAKLLNKLRCFDEESTIYQHALRLDPKAWSLHAALGDSYCGQGRFTQAIDSYQTAIQLKPDAPELHKKLEGALQTRDHLEGGIGLYPSAVKLQSISPASLPSQNKTPQGLVPPSKSADLLPTPKVVAVQEHSQTQNLFTPQSFADPTKSIEWTAPKIVIAALCFAIPYITFVVVLASAISISAAMPLIIAPCAILVLVAIVYGIGLLGSMKPRQNRRR